LLDPQNWNDFRRHAHDLLDTCISYLESAQDNFWRPVKDGAIQSLSPPLPRKGQSTSSIIKTLKDNVLPYATGNTHPRFFGWVHGTGLANNLLADMVISTMNSNCGGRNHGAVYVERTVVDWCKEIFGFPAAASGLLTNGTSQSTMIALSAARIKTFGIDVNKHGIQSIPDVKVYCAEGTHACVEKALQLMGHGSDSLQKIPVLQPFGEMDQQALELRISQDRANGFIPLCIVATAGSVNTGSFDDIGALASLGKREGIWVHVDGAFGAWVHIAEEPWASLTSGIENVDSIAFDFHKWMFVQYACGAVLIKDSDAHYKSFSMPSSAEYISSQGAALSSGHPWFCNYTSDLSRDFKALKVWTALLEHGLDSFSEAITMNCKQAAYMAELIESSPELKLAAPVVSNICTFHYVGNGVSDKDKGLLNEKIVCELQLGGEAVFSTTKINGRTAIRAAIVNHRTVFEDIDLVIKAVIRVGIACHGVFPPRKN
jgi:aromatic-L-amino-acid decarboxylase